MINLQSLQVFNHFDGLYPIWYSPLHVRARASFFPCEGLPQERSKICVFPQLSQLAREITQIKVFQAMQNDG